ncbi:hypothetical protein DXG01_016523 [Tephrocybe rancida]|nr:hypothetical protein DXG01_016523 [Tephrocybe rancida]
MSEFPEEPLDAVVGYIPAKPDDILNDGRYTILRKLGWGLRSSTWLVADNKDPESILAAKIFTIEATEDCSALHEKQFYEGLGKHHSEVPIHQGSFEHESPRGTHLVLLFIHIGPSVEDLRLRNTSGGYLPVHIVKKVVARVVSILTDVHEWNMVHGAVKAKNVLIASVWTADAIRSELEASPTAPVIRFVEGKLQDPYPIVKSQPLDHGFQWDSSAEDFVEADIHLVSFGNGKPYSIPTARIMSLMIWNHQCIKQRTIEIERRTFMMWGLTHSFRKTFHLLTGTAFLSEDVDRVEDLLTEVGNVAATDIPSAATFIKNCMKDLSEVPNAYDLLGNFWFKDAILFP